MPLLQYLKLNLYQLLPICCFLHIYFLHVHLQMYYCPDLYCYVRVCSYHAILFSRPNIMGFPCTHICTNFYFIPSQDIICRGSYFIFLFGQKYKSDSLIYFFFPSHSILILNTWFSHSLWLEQTLARLWGDFTCAALSCHWNNDFYCFDMDIFLYSLYSWCFLPPNFIMMRESKLKKLYFFVAETFCSRFICKFASAHRLRNL